MGEGIIKMQKKEIILSASLLNALILAFLLTTAVHESIPQTHELTTTHPVTDSTRMPPPTTPSAAYAFVSPSDAKVITLDPWPHDEVDQALQPYLAKQENVSLPHEPPSTPHPVETQATTVRAPPPQEDYQEVIVKRGDALDKISRQFGVPVKEIKRMNQLTSDRLNIGQLLILPKSGGTAEAAAPQRNASADKIADKVADRVTDKAAPSSTLEAQSYVMKTGDNPWKIARAHKMKPEDLLELNGWTEESARNLKPGDIIRVHTVKSH